MRIAFIDPSGWDFNVETPFTQPLGGAHSAASYLAIAMAAAGHDVHFITHTSAPGMIRGVDCLSTREFTPNQLPSLDLNATILRPWYVLGPRHRWPYVLLPFYWICERLPATRDGALRLGLVTIDDMLKSLVWAVENPDHGVMIVDVPRIRQLGRADVLM